MSGTRDRFRINHVAIVVSDIEAGLAFWRDALAMLRRALRMCRLLRSV
ncbi:MAG: VOC family protein, partial [Aggregatilineales bacterium]